MNHDAYLRLMRNVGGTPTYTVVPHPSGGWTPLVHYVGMQEPKAHVRDPQFTDPWLALESVAADNRDKIFHIDASWSGEHIIGDLNDIANEMHRPSDT